MWLHEHAVVVVLSNYIIGTDQMFSKPLTTHSGKVYANMLANSTIHREVVELDFVLQMHTYCVTSIS